MVPARASHPYPNPNNTHLWSVHYSNDEYFCAESRNGASTTSAQLRDRVEATLTSDRVDVHWHATASNLHPGGNFWIYS